MELTGDWKKAGRIATGLKARFQKAVAAAVMAEGQHLRGQIVKGIRSGAPGGKQFAPLSPITIALRKAGGFGGSKPLVRTGALVGGIVAVKRNGGVFVGLLRQSQGKGGGGKSLANIGAIHEFGASWTQTLTPKARRFLFAVLKKAGLSRGAGDNVTLQSGARAIRKGGRWRDMKGRFLSGAQLAEAKAASAAAQGQKAAPAAGGSTITITIPARPFIGPVLEKEGTPEKVRRRFWDNVAKGMGYDLGKP